ncbi:hypothetical protein J2X76_004807 [Neorhizobium sp. 2083]|uniref:hypothetical protein n=1 Tax=Neorhizobium sp. 2083 TaxID=2817762 RepID=UPI000DDDA627|nr:hypothetical protein [Neorhizobium sp. 2083]MDR6819615.1 hypothetical protein [Neorhizobium sp. 2083]
MNDPDFSEYEKLRAEQHEELCRAASSLMRVDLRLCRLRSCRRKRVCSGPMLPSPHQAWAVRAHEEIGLSGKACAKLPLCIANQHAWIFAPYKKLMTDLQQLTLDEPETDLIPACLKVAARRRLPRSALDFPAPSSDFKQETKG